MATKRKADPKDGVENNGVVFEFVGSGSVVREYNSYIWNEENKHQCRVDLATAAELITYPKKDRFKVVPGQYLSPESVKALAHLLSTEMEEVQAMFASEKPEYPTVHLPPPPLSAVPGISEARQVDLLEYKIGDAAVLAGLTEAAMDDLSPKIGVPVSVLKDWVAAAQELIGN